VETTYGAPRTLLTVTVKRDNPHWFDLYGHWWVEAGERSWGWWPREIPVGVRQLAQGTEGVLNETGLVGRRGTWQRDPQHGRHAAHAFHPVLVEPIPEAEVVARLQAYADGYRGEWRWAWTRRSAHDTCRTFQDGLLAAGGLTETLADLPSRGSGCPFLYPPRTVLWRAQDLLDAARGRLTSRAAPGGATGRSAHVLSTYERVAGRYDRYWRRLWLLVAGRAAEQAMLDAITRAVAGSTDAGRPLLLDAGAGTGALSRRLAQALPDVHPVLVDISPGMLARAADLHDPRAVASVEALPFADGTFDVVMSAWVIETVDDPAAAVTEMLRVLRPGGLVAYSFCSRPVRRRDRWRTGPTRAVVHALFAGHFLREEQTPFHACATSRRSSFAAGAASVVLLGKCCAVADAEGAWPRP
jgi:ubiquinone/menaquinone biosynthesis C-methylase UbiE